MVFRMWNFNPNLESKRIKSISSMSAPLMSSSSQGAPKVSLPLSCISQDKKGHHSLSGNKVTHMQETGSPIRETGSPIKEIGFIFRKPGPLSLERNDNNAIMVRFIICPGVDIRPKDNGKFQSTLPLKVPGNHFQHYQFIKP